MSLLARIVRGDRDPARTDLGLNFDDWVSYFSFNGTAYPYQMGSGTLAQEHEVPPSDFAGYVHQLYRTNGVVFACMAVRQRIFSEARFQLQTLIGGVPGDLFGSKILAPLERPWGPSSTTGDLLTRMVQDADLAGNAYIGRLPGGQLTHMRPDWVTIIIGSRMNAKAPNWQLDAEVAGYMYQPGGRGGGQEPVLLLPENVAHFAPYPDPLARFRGMPWLTPVIREVMGDTAAMQHKLKFFELGATPNTVVTMGDTISPENFVKFVEMFEEQHQGVGNAYRTLFFGGGASVDVIGTNMEQLSFKETQGHGETRIAAAAGVPPIIVGLSEGLDAATYSNYGQARRAFADITMRPLWRDVAASLEPLIDLAALPGGGVGTHLWYDDRHIPFLQDDVKDAAEVQAQEATTINTLITAGFTPDDVVAAVVSGDLSRLKGKHSGLVSVQLFEPGQGPAKAQGTEPPANAPAGNGKGANGAVPPKLLPAGKPA